MPPPFPKPDAISNQTAKPEDGLSLANLQNSLTTVNEQQCFVKYKLNRFEIFENFILIASVNIYVM